MPRTNAAALCGVILFVVILCTPLPAARGADVDADEVRQAIDRGIEFLRRSQKPDGNWTGSTVYTGGITALCALAMMEAGVEPRDPAVAKALANLRLITPDRTYSVALQTMALARAGDATDLPIIRRNAEWLERTQLHDGENQGAWGYPLALAGRQVDNSNTQFALLALYEAERAGIDVNPETWTQALRYWERTKIGHSSWSYLPNNPQYPSTGSMTCAGISSMIIASGSVNLDDAKADASGCHCTDVQSSQTVDEALAWLGNNFSVSRNPELGRGIGESRRANYFYFLYGMERAGRLSGQRLFLRTRGGKVQPYDWYREGAEALVKKQDHITGEWEGDGPGESIKEVATSFALLFLAKGRRPVLISKLQRPGKDWNLLRHDLAHLTAYTEQKWKLPMTWQTIDGSTATLSDYYQTPVLFISGRDAIKFNNDAQKQLLRAYVDEGGFIFADACCDGGEFEKSFRQLMEEIFPEPQLQLKPLDPDHPIWSIEEKVNPKYLDPKKRWLWGIDVGCRTSVVLSNGNLSCYWEIDRPRRGDQALSPKVAEELAACRAMGINVLAYATNRKLQPKDAIPREVRKEDTKTTSPRGHLAVAKLRHAGGCDDAPRALTNLMEALGHTYEIRVDPKAPLLDITDESLFNFHMVFMQGRNDFRLSTKEVDQLRTFLDRGGMIFGDALCASPAFATAFRREMGRLFPGQALQQIPIADPLFSQAYGGQDIRKVTRREAIRHKQGEPLEVKLRENVEPVLEGIKVGERYAVIFSPFDVSCALERHASPQCRGYTSDDAARIAINVILYSLHD